MTTWRGQNGNAHPLGAIALEDGRVLVEWDLDPAVYAAGCHAYVSSDGLASIVGVESGGDVPLLCTTLLSSRGFLTASDIRAVCEALYGPRAVPNIVTQDLGALTVSVDMEGPFSLQFGI